MVGLDIEMELRKIWCEGEDCTLLTSVINFAVKKIRDWRCSN